jgi:hypothetical protein
MGFIPLFISPCLARAPLNIMGADAVEDVRNAADRKGEAVGLRDAGFPDVAALGVALALSFLPAVRGDGDFERKNGRLSQYSA